MSLCLVYVSCKLDISVRVCLRINTYMIMFYTDCYFMTCLHVIRIYRMVRRFIDDISDLSAKRIGYRGYDRPTVLYIIYSVASA